MFKRLDFPILKCAIVGMRQLMADRFFLAAIISFPIIIGSVVLIASDIFNVEGNALWLGVLKVPDDFVKGITIAVYVRYLLFKQMPSDAIKQDDAQRAIAISTIIFTVLGLLFAGIVALLSSITDMKQLEQGATPDMLSIVGSGIGLVAILWLFRYQWLPVAAAAGMDVKEFTKGLGYGLGLPFRIFGLWFICSIPAFVILTLSANILSSLSNAGDQGLDAPLLWVLFVINAIVATITVLIQSAASVHAIRFCMGHKDKSL